MHGQEIDTAAECRAAGSSERVRDDAREHRRPTRDDIARTLLWQMIVTAKQKRRRDEILERLCGEIVAELTLQGFDIRESEAVFEALTEKYEPEVRPFHIKRRLEGEDRTGGSQT